MDSDLLAEYLLYKQSLKPEAPVKQSVTENKKCKCKEEQKEIIELHCGEFAKSLNIIIRAVLTKYNALDEFSIKTVDKGTIVEIVDKVIERAGSEIAEVKKIIAEEGCYPFGRYYLLRQLIELLMFIKIF